MRQRARTDPYRGRRAIAVPTVTHKGATSTSSAARTSRQAGDQAHAQFVTQRGERVGDVALRAPGCRVGRNQREQQGARAVQSFFEAACAAV